MAERYCREVLERPSHLASPVVAQRPPDPEAAVRWLLLDLWDGQLVDVWIRENARDCVYADHYKSEDAPYELERYLQKLGV